MLTLTWSGSPQKLQRCLSLQVQTTVEEAVPVDWKYNILYKQKYSVKEYKYAKKYELHDQRQLTIVTPHTKDDDKGKYDMDYGKQNIEKDWKFRS